MGKRQGRFQLAHEFASPSPLAVGGRVYLVDDDADVLHHVGELLVVAGYEVHAFSAGSRLLAEARIESPAVVLLDMTMSDMRGIDVQSALARTHPAVTVVYLSGDSRPQEIIDALKIGADDFLTKPVSGQVLLAAVHKAMHRSIHAVGRHRVLQLVRQGVDRLSRREREIYALLIDGWPNRQIAMRLGIRPDTVKKHRVAICEKFGARDTQRLISLSLEAARAGFVLEADLEVAREFAGGARLEAEFSIG